MSIWQQPIGNSQLKNQPIEPFEIEYLCLFVLSTVSSRKTKTISISRPNSHQSKSRFSELNTRSRDYNLSSIAPVPFYLFPEFQNFWPRVLSWLWGKFSWMIPKSIMIWFCLKLKVVNTMVSYIDIKSKLTLFR